jgi:hypothetical protein
MGKVTKCEICSMIFENEIILERHQKNIHENKGDNT